MKRRGRMVLLALALACSGCATTPTDPERLPDTDPLKIASLNTELGVEYMRKGDNEVALRKLEKALAAAPNFAGAHSAMGLLYARLGQIDEAESHFREATRLAPEDSSILNNFGQFLCQRQRWDEADALFQRAVKNALYETPEVAYANAGTCAKASGDLAKAEGYFRQALQLDAELGPALLGMAELSFEQKRYLPARAYLQRLSAVAPQTPRTLWLGVRVERALGDRDAADSYALALKNRFPDSDETRHLLESAP